MFKLIYKVYGCFPGNSTPFVVFFSFCFGKFPVFSQQRI